MPNLPQLSPRSRARLNQAVDYLTIYILGCQPEVLRQHGSRRAVTSLAEPDNLGWYGYDRAMWLLDQTGEDLQQLAIDLAWARAEQLAKVAGYDLPLITPRRLAH